MFLERLILFSDLEMARPTIAGLILRATVNEMRTHFRPVEDSVNLVVGVEGACLKLTMELPLDDAP